MCHHLLRAGYRVALHSHTKARANPLLDLGKTGILTVAQPVFCANRRCKKITAQVEWMRDYTVDNGWTGNP